MTRDRLDLDPIDTEGCLIAIGLFIALIGTFAAVML
jgi:hypothetical protein